MKVRYYFPIVVLAAAVSRAAIAAEVDLQARPFPLTQVRLLDGPFRDAMVRDENYLLSLQPDRLLSWFRKDAGLPTVAQAYGGWESSGLAGHTLGHYLSACSRMYQDTGDKRFLDRVNYIVSQLAECQKANTNGYVAAIPKGKEIFGKVAQGVIDTQGFGLNGGWSPWYTIHKELAGLIDAYRLCGDAQALDVATNLANWVDATTKNLSPAQWQHMLVCEYGGINEALANLYGITDNPRYLELAERFYDNAVLAPLAAGRDDLTGKHDNTQTPKIVGAARIYELTGDPKYAKLARFYWNDVALHRSYAIGGSGDGEYFFPTNQWARHVNASTCETCPTYNMLKLTKHLFEWSPSATEMDFYERALYNDILASQDPETGMFVYLMSLEPGGFKTFSTPENSFWCCVGTGMENHSRYGDAIYFHGDNSLYVNLFIASELAWPEKNLTLRQETKFPDRDTTQLKFQCASPVKLALKIRWPAWADKISVRVNGRKQKITGQPSSYVTIDRKWRDGDRVDVELPMKLHAEPLPGTTNLVALLDGPIVLAGDLGTNGMPADVYATDQTKFAKWPAPSVPVFVANNLKSLLRHVHPTRQPLVFRTRRLGRPNDVTLIPFYQANHERYNVYWTVLNKAEWKAKSAKAHAAP
jgi:uncharacterized protein